MFGNTVKWFLSTVVSNVFDIERQRAYIVVYCFEVQLKAKAKSKGIPLKRQY